LQNQPAANYVEAVAAWSALDWSIWLRNRARLYFATGQTLHLLPFGVNPDRSAGPQIWAQLMKFQPDSLPTLAVAARWAAETWASEDGLAPLKLYLTLAGLAHARGLLTMLRVVDGKLPRRLADQDRDDAFAPISDYVLDRLTPEEIEQFAREVRERRGEAAPFAFLARCFARLVRAKDPMPWNVVARLAYAILPLEADLGEEDARFLRNRLKEAIGETGLKRLVGSGVGPDPLMTRLRRTGISETILENHLPRAAILVDVNGPWTTSAEAMEAELLNEPFPDRELVFEV
jgi:hypothetical protein